MCGGPKQSKPSDSAVAAMTNLTVDTDDSFSSLLELAANNDVDAFRRSAALDPAAVDDAGLWYGRSKALEQRTPLMVAATYGSLDVLRLILSLCPDSVNSRCGPDVTSPLHCAASGASPLAGDAARLLLSAGADPDLPDALGRRPADVILVHPNHRHLKLQLQDLLLPLSLQALRISTTTSSSSSTSPRLSSSPTDSTSSSPPAVSEKKEYPIDPSLPDIKNSIYSTDEFRMFSFKIRPCSRAYSHDWTECPFVHPGENARRRDPRKYHYSCVPCPDFRKGACRRGDLCEYAHGVFECWLHPAQYRTRLCKDGTACNRRVCFFAHTSEELRPLYLSTGSRSSAMEMAAAMSSFTPASPMSPPMSNWQQPSVPTLHLPGSYLQSSRLRSSLSARDMPPPPDDLLSELDAQQLNEAFFSSAQAGLAQLRPGRSKTLNPSNLDDLFSAEVSLSPRYNSSDQAAVFSPSLKPAMLNQLQQQPSLLSPINTSKVFTPLALGVDPHHLSAHSSLLHASLGIASPGRMSPRSVELHSPLSARLSVMAQREKLQLRSLSSRDLGAPLSSSWSKWGSPTGKPDWGVNGQDLGKLVRSSSFEASAGGEEPDVSWVQSLVSPPEVNEKNVSCNPAVDGSNPNGEIEDHAVLGAWLEQMQLDHQLVA